MRWSWRSRRRAPAFSRSPRPRVPTRVGNAPQAAKLDALSEKWRKRQAREEDEGAQLVGWSKAAEITNGRFAMFFLPVGLITEYYTGESVPQQVYTLLQTLGFVE